MSERLQLTLRASDNNPTIYPSVKMKGKCNAMATNDIPRREPNPKRPAGGKRRPIRPREIHTADWSEVPNQAIRDVVVAITNAGAAIMFGRTSDKGAFSITVLDGDERIREWPHTAEECESTIRWLLDMFATD